LDDKTYPQNKVLAGYIDLAVYDWLVQYGLTPEEPQLWFRKNELLHSRHSQRTGKDKNKEHKSTVAVSEIYTIPSIIQIGKVHWDTVNKAVIYSSDAEDGSDNKVAIRINYKLGDDRSNFIVTIGRVSKNKLVAPQFIEIER
jgi:hypothetical protein